MRRPQQRLESPVEIHARTVTLHADLAVPAGATGIVLCAQASAGSRRSPRMRYLAHALHGCGMATLLCDLLTRAEEDGDGRDHCRSDIALLAERLARATRWVNEDSGLRDFRIGYFAAGAGSAAALVAAAELGALVSSAVCRGGRPDLANVHLERVTAATLLIVGGTDRTAVNLSEAAYDRLRCGKRLIVVPGTTEAFAEPPAQEEAAALASDWFFSHLVRGKP